MAYNILMRVHEDIETVIFRLPQHFNRMLDPFFIVFPRSCRLDCLPSKNISNGIVTPLLQPREVDICLFFRERAATKVNIIPIEKVLGDMRRQLRRAGILCIASEIDSSKCYLAAMGVTELAILNSKPQRHVVQAHAPNLGYSGVVNKIPARSLEG